MKKFKDFLTEEAEEEKTYTHRVRWQHPYTKVKGYKDHSSKDQKKSESRAIRAADALRKRGYHNVIVSRIGEDRNDT